MLWSSRSGPNIQIWLSYENVSPEVCQKVKKADIVTLVTALNSFHIFQIDSNFFLWGVGVFLSPQIWVSSAGKCHIPGSTKCFSCYSSSVQYLA